MGVNVKSIRLLSLLMALLLLPALAQAALSLEALEMVETLRRNLNNVEPDKPQDIATGEYVVGHELGQALARLRHNLYGTTAPVSRTSTRKEIDSGEKMRQAINEPAAELYIAGLELRQAIERVKQTRRPGEINNQIEGEPPASIEHLSAAEPADLSDAEPAPASADDSSVKIASDVAGESETGGESPDISSSIRDSGKISKRISRLRQQLKQPAAETPVTPDPVRDPEVEDGEDRSINRELSRYEFKMPSSYRIIVR